MLKQLLAHVGKTYSTKSYRKIIMEVDDCGKQ
jgi:hypothetical protein